MKAVTVFVSVIILIGAHTSFSQENIKWFEKEHNFDEIKEEGGYADHTFKFINTSLDSIKVTYVKASCGCTTPSWSRGFIAPGDTGLVMARYNPFNRPGPFRKSLNVKTSQGDNINLYIKGTVIPRPKTVAEKLPVLIGNLRFKYNAINMGRITTEKEVKKTFQLYNESDSTIIIKEVKSPDYAIITFNSGSIKAREEVEMYVMYDPVEVGNPGFYNDNVQLITTDSEVPVKNLDLVASITEYFPPMSEEEMAQAPRLFIEESNYNFGSLGTNSEEQTVINLTNNGASKLNIRNVLPNCDCIEVDLKSENIKPGKSAELQVVFKGEGRKGRQYKTITVYSNDPLAPTQVISIRADIK